MFAVYIVKIARLPFINSHKLFFLLKDSAKITLGCILWEKVNKKWIM